MGIALCMTAELTLRDVLTAAPIRKDARAVRSAALGQGGAG
jgi:hypothetical protein